METREPMTNKEIREWAEPIVADFKDIGINTLLYKRPPNFSPRSDFFISIDRNKKPDRLNIWPTLDMIDEMGCS